MLDLENIIEVKNLVKKFKNITAVDNISFNVKRGEIFGFLGPNGAGKSTTINMICTLIRPTSGSIHLNGFDTASQKNKVRSCLGLVFQDNSLDEKLTAVENLNFHAMLYGIPKDIKYKRIFKVLEMVNLVKRKNDLVSTFSGGMKRRLEIARGLIHYPKMLFLDEPTLGLDPQARSKIWSYIMELKRNQNITIFLTTHYMEETENCDRIAIIDRGKIIALDSPENLKKQAGGEIMTVSSLNNHALKAFIESSYKVKAEILKGQSVKFEIKGRGSELIPQIIKNCPVEITAISARQPTLEDVFLGLTGREIRDETIDKKNAFIMRERMIKRR